MQMPTPKLSIMEAEIKESKKTKLENGDINEETKKRRKVQKEEGAYTTTEDTLGDKLGSININDKKEIKKESQILPTTQSLSTVLVQALKSNDNSMLDHCLFGTTTNQETVQNTVRRLPITSLIPFLNVLSKKLLSNPNAANLIVVWIRSILLHHTSYLMTIPDITKILSRLHQTVDSRLTVFKKLVKLSGRLELVLSQIAQHNTAENSAIVPLTVYNEGEEEGNVEEEVMEFDENEDDKEGEEEGDSDNAMNEDEENEDEEEDDDGGNNDDEDDEDDAGQVQSDDEEYKIENDNDNDNESD